MKELCEAREKLEMSSNFQIYPQGVNLTLPFLQLPPLHSPLETARGQSELFAFQCDQ